MVRNGIEVVERLLVRGHNYLPFFEPLPCGEMPLTPDFLEMIELSKHCFGIRLVLPCLASRFFIRP